jgi:hypothetical protein
MECLESTIEIVVRESRAYNSAHTEHNRREGAAEYEAFVKVLRKHHLPTIACTPELSGLACWGINDLLKVIREAYAKQARLSKEASWREIAAVLCKEKI